MKFSLVDEGGIDHELTPIQAADLFAEKYLPGLEAERISLPKEVVDFGLTIQGFQPLPDGEKETITSSMTDKKDQTNFNDHGKLMKGAENEISVWEFIQKSVHRPSALFWSYKQMKTYRFLGVQEKNKKTGILGDWTTEQEYDMILLLPQHRVFVVVEVKSYASKVQKKTLDPLVVGHTFFTNLQKYIGDEGWKYIPIVALPNVETRDKAENVNLRQHLDFVLITAEEMKDELISVLVKDNKIKEQPNHPIDEAYTLLTKVLYASAHSQQVSKSTGNVGLQLFTAVAPEDPANKTHEKLFGKEEEDVSAGFSKETLPGKVKFSDVKNTGVGELKSMIFWNPEQFEIIRSNYNNNLVIVGEYGVGKTLLLMSKVQTYLNNRQKVIFTCDARNSCKIFDYRISNFCSKHDIEFSSFNLKTEREAFEDMLMTNDPCNNLVIDELDSRNFEYVCEVTSMMQQVICVINPGEKMEEVEQLKVPSVWKRIHLNKVMRNSANIYAAAKYRVEPPGSLVSSTVLGMRPRHILINPGDFSLGFFTALNLMKKENKIIVILNAQVDMGVEVEYDYTWEGLRGSISDTLTKARPEVPLYYSSKEKDIKQFFDSTKGCFVGKERDFHGMEAKNLIIVGTIKETKKNLLLRCSTQLVYVDRVDYFYYSTDTNFKDWNYIVPYKQESESYKQCIAQFQKSSTTAEKKLFFNKLSTVEASQEERNFNQSMKMKRMRKVLAKFDFSEYA